MTRVAPILLVAAAAVQAPAAAETILIRDVNVIPMTRQIVLPDASVLIEGDTITAIGRSLEAPRGARVIEGAGTYLIPGLADMHVHLSSRRGHWLEKYLGNGVTTVRNMHGSATVLQWREEVRRGSRLGPEIVTSSPFTSRDDAPAYRRLLTPQEARAAVREFAAAGYDLVKVVTLDSDVFQALMDEAARHDLPVAGHIPSVLVDLYGGYPVQDLDFSRALTLQQVLDSGMVSIEHLDELYMMGFARVPDKAGLAELVRRVRRSGTAVTTLLGRNVVNNARLADPDGFLTPRRLDLIRRYLDESYLEQAEQAVEAGRKLEEPERRLQMRDVDSIGRLLKALNDEGVPVLVGTDSGGLLIHAGDGLLNELDLFVQAGLTPYETLRAATVNPARVLGRWNRAGSVEVGKLADLVLLDANPLDGLATLRSPAGVLVRGRWLDRETLRRMRQQ